MDTVTIIRFPHGYGVYGLRRHYMTTYAKAFALYRKLSAAGHRVFVDLGN